ncbi:MAG: CvpA family protein [Gammaproteobacteria bacterium]|nr:CvpA family protein [Gammaproteobacteria bacterium]MCP5201623.1 CvpA family protein [Gammaproteobacteria bacterium]
MNWADIAILAVILVSILVSVLRGFVKEMLSLLAWVAAFWMAIHFSSTASALLEPYVAVATARLVIAFVAVLVATLIGVGVVNFVIGKLIESTGLSGTDRLLGAVFGFARGAAIVGIAVLLAGLTPLPTQPWWQEAQTIPPFETAALYALNWLPPDLAGNFAF